MGRPTGDQNAPYAIGFWPLRALASPLRILQSLPNGTVITILTPNQNLRVTKSSSMISHIREWNEDRQTLIQLKHERAYIIQRFEEKKKTLKIRTGSEEDSRIYFDFRFDIDQIDAQIDQIESKKMLRRARKWGLPIPPKPNEYQQENEFWVWSDPHFEHYLSPEGKKILRRECFTEMEMFYKPWATWLAVGVSFLSLLISLLR